MATNKPSVGAQPGNDNASGPNSTKKRKVDELPDWYKLARKRYGAGMSLHEARGHYNRQDGKYIAALGRVSIYMPTDHRKIKDHSRPIVVNTPDGAQWVRNDREAHAVASQAAAAIHNAERARRLAENPLRIDARAAESLRRVLLNR